MPEPFLEHYTFQVHIKCFDSKVDKNSLIIKTFLHALKQIVATDIFSLGMNEPNRFLKKCGSHLVVVPIDPPQYCINALYKSTQQGRAYIPYPSFYM